MIPLLYDISDPDVRTALKPYDDYIVHFRDKTLAQAIKRGYVGYHKTDRDGNDTTLYLKGDDLKLAKWLHAHIISIANMEATYMIRFICAMDRIWNISSSLYRLKWLNHLFVENGYDGGSFPKDSLARASKIDVCPYCNRNTVGCVDLRKVEHGKIVTKTLKGQLDHFYYKAKYPYLAISRNNLVPCCKDCNEHPNKLTEDAVATNLVNPFLLNHPDGMLFRIAYPWDLYGSKIKCTDATIEIDTTPNPFFTRNDYTFGLTQIYNRFHIDVAVRVNNAYMYTQNRKYRKGIDDMTQELDNQIIDDYQAFKESCGAVDKSLYIHIPLSKLATDIWYQLENGL